MTDPTPREILPPDTVRAYPAMHALRPHLADPDAFVRQIDTVQRPAGYRLVGAFGAGPDAEAVAGFREQTNTAYGRHLYIDDLSTLPQCRRRGHGRRLLEWVHAEAMRLGITAVHLDSGVGENRQDAHRLYFNTGYRITSYHFVRAASGQEAHLQQMRSLTMPADPAKRLRRIRHAVRVIMVDPRDRVLLLGDSDPMLPDYAWWVTPGGGIDPGETERAAAVREVAEETGCVITEDALVGPLAFRHAVHGYSDQVVEQDESFYLVRVQPFEMDISRHTEEEQLTLTRHRWWTRAELERTDEWIWPAELLLLWDRGTEDPRDNAPIDLGRVTTESTRPV